MQTYRNIYIYINTGRSTRSGCRSLNDFLTDLPAGPTVMAYCSLLMVRRGATQEPLQQECVHGGVALMTVSFFPMAFCCKRDRLWVLVQITMQRPSQWLLQSNWLCVCISGWLTNFLGFLSTL